MLHRLLTSIGRFFHRLFNPHCPDCLDDKSYQERGPFCSTCEFLKMELAKDRQERAKLVDLLARKDTPSVQEEHSIDSQVPLNVHIPWHIRKARLEQADREKLQQLKTEYRSQTVQELEKELGVEEIHESLA